MDYFISVIVPAYNEETYIGPCLQALKKQAQNVEIIVIDNNSTDKTAEIARSYGVRVVKESIQGMTPAREKGFQEAKGEIILRTDADTIVPPDWISILSAPFADPSVVAAFGGLSSPDTKKYPEILFIIYNWFYVMSAYILSGHHALLGPNMAVRKSTWKKIKVHMDDRLVHEDMDLACHLAPYGKIVYLPECRIPYDIRRFRKSFFKTAIEYPWRFIRTIFIHYRFFS